MSPFLFSVLSIVSPVRRRVVFYYAPPHCVPWYCLAILSYCFAYKKKVRENEQKKKRRRKWQKTSILLYAPTKTVKLPTYNYNKKPDYRDSGRLLLHTLRNDHTLPSARDHDLKKKSARAEALNGAPALVHHAKLSRWHASHNSQPA